MTLTGSIRLTKVVIALMPAFLGLFALLNNLSDYKGTLDHVLVPIMCMKDTFGNPAQTWRSLCSVPLMHTVFIAVIMIETIICAVGFWGVYRMASTVRATSAAFRDSCRLTSLACLLGILVWGLGFFVIIGDWFLVWQGDFKPFRTDGLTYSAIMIICLLAINHADKE